MRSSVSGGSEPSVTETLTTPQGSPERRTGATTSEVTPSARSRSRSSGEIGPSTSRSRRLARVADRLVRLPGHGYAPSDGVGIDLAVFPESDDESLLGLRAEADMWVLSAPSNSPDLLGDGLEDVLGALRARHGDRDAPQCSLLVLPPLALGDVCAADHEALRSLALRQRSAGSRPRGLGGRLE